MTAQHYVGDGDKLLKPYIAIDRLRRVKTVTTDDIDFKAFFEDASMKTYCGVPGLLTAAAGSTASKLHLATTPWPVTGLIGLACLGWSGANASYSGTRANLHTRLPCRFIKDNDTDDANLDAAFDAAITAGDKLLLAIPFVRFTQPRARGRVTFVGGTGPTVDVREYRFDLAAGIVYEPSGGVHAGLGHGGEFETADCDGHLVAFRLAAIANAPTSVTLDVEAV